MASEDLGYNILHHINSLANGLIGPTIPHPTSAPAPGLAILLLPPWVDKPLDCPHPETDNALLEPLVYPASISRNVNLSTLNWSMGTYHGTSFPYAKDSPDHEPQFIGVNFAGCLCTKQLLGQLLH